MVEELTNREQEVLKIICEKGVFKNKDIAKMLNISVTTVHSHIYNILSKMLVQSKTELVYKYYTGGKE